MLRLSNIPEYAVNFSNYLKCNLEIHFKLVTISGFHFSSAARTVAAGRYLCGDKSVGKTSGQIPTPNGRWTGLHQFICCEYSQCLWASLLSLKLQGRDNSTSRDLFPNAREISTFLMKILGSWAYAKGFFWNAVASYIRPERA